MFLCVIAGAINVKEIVSLDDLELESLEWNHSKVINHILISDLVESHTMRLNLSKKKGVKLWIAHPMYNQHMNMNAFIRFSMELWLLIPFFSRRVFLFVFFLFWNKKNTSCYTSINKLHKCSQLLSKNGAFIKYIVPTLSVLSAQCVNTQKHAHLNAWLKWAIKTFFSHSPAKIAWNVIVWLFFYLI